jgi:hypothetical protein
MVPRLLTILVGRSRKLDLNAFSGKIVGVKIKHTRRSRGKPMVREKVERL